MNKPFFLKLESVWVYKFGALINKKSANKSNSVDILPQIVEINLFCSLFDPLKRAEIIVNDRIGLLHNFPISGEEVFEISYMDSENNLKTHSYVVDSISEIIADDRARTMMYSINLSSIEAYVNARQTVSHAYHGSMSDALSECYQKYIQEPLQKFYPSFKPTPTFMEADEKEYQNRTVVIPNIHPLEACKMLARLCVSSQEVNATWFFYQTLSRHRLETAQSIFKQVENPVIRSKLLENSYKYISDEIEGNQKFQNDSRIITNLEYNERHANLRKIGAGYFQNAYYEINMAQKSFQITQTRTEQIKTIEKNRLNTAVFEQFTPIEGNNQEVSNLTRYVINNARENDDQYYMPSYRKRWGKNIAGATALSQVDLVISIPGDMKVDAGQMIHVEIPEVHGFNKIQADPYLSGFFIIAEVKHTIKTGGHHATVLRINKDSYGTTIDRDSKYA